MQFGTLAHARANWPGYVLTASLALMAVVQSAGEFRRMGEKLRDAGSYRVDAVLREAPLARAEWGSR